jgi:RHS repeat-associated protein
VKSGVDDVARPLPGGGGGVNSIGESFRPNLAMGGGSYRIPFDLPHGPGGITPKLELVYNTGLGNGPFGVGWSLAVPFVERQRVSPFTAPGEVSFTISGSEPLMPLADGRFASQSDATRQVFSRVGDAWECRTPDLVVTTFGSTDGSRVSGEVDGAAMVARWLLDTVTFPNDETVRYDHEVVDGECRLAAMRWSRFRLDFDYEARPDPSVSYASGFAQPSSTRCRSVTLHYLPGTGPAQVARRWELAYAQAPGVETTLLESVTLVGWHDEAGTTIETRLAPLSFAYTEFTPGDQRIRKLGATTVPPPPLGDDTTLFDYRGTSLPGVLRLNREGAMWWENRGDGTFGAPESIRLLPAGVTIGDDGVRFADLTGNGTADLLVGAPGGGAWWEHDPALGFTRRHDLRLAPGFDVSDSSVFVDLDGDGIVDLLVLDDSAPLGFFNDRGESWTGPVVLPWGDAPQHLERDRRLRLADMNGDGMVDLVLVRSRGVVYWPGMGGGRFGPAVEMIDTPDFERADPDHDVLVADIDGDGTADLILLGASSVTVHLNQGGRRYAPPIRLGRTPRLAGDRVLTADMAGNGCGGLLWAMPEVSGAGGYLYLDLLGGTKPYLLSRIDNGAGIVTEIEYTSSSAERARDVAAGRRWRGYLPFPVQVVKKVTSRDQVTAQVSTTRYRYHDAQFDGTSRQWLGFGDVECDDEATDHEAASRQHQFFHNQVDTATTPAFVAGRGQPYRTDIIDPATDAVLQTSEAAWDAIPADPSDPAAGAWIAVEKRRVATRYDAGAVYSLETIDYERDEVGNLVRQHRRGEWTGSDGVAHVDEAVTVTAFAVHATHGITSFPSSKRHFDAAGTLLKSFEYFYDGPAFIGLASGIVERGFLSRQTEVALTPAAVTAVYGDLPTVPAGLVTDALADLYRLETDADLGPLHLKDTRRYRLDATGNQVETIDALGHHITITYDADGLLPVTIADGDSPPRAVTFDPVIQQANLVTDVNGNTVRTRYDGLGNMIAVWRRGADPARPTETYTWDRSALPHSVDQEIRVQPDDAEPGWRQLSYFDGAARACQTRTRTADGQYAVGGADVLTIRGRTVGSTAAYFDPSPAYAPPPAGVARRTADFDAAGRLAREHLYNGSDTVYRYVGADTQFFDPLATAALAHDPATPASRTSRTDPWGRVVEIVEFDGASPVVERRGYDALDRLSEIVDPAGNVALHTVFDGWGNAIRIDGADTGTVWRLFNAGNGEVARIDADARVLWREHDGQGRVRRLFDGGPSGTLEESYAYDTGPGTNLVGRLARVEGSFGTVSYSYDVEGQPVQIDRTIAPDPTTYTTAFTYDSQKHVRSVRYPDGRTVQYDYTPDGLLASIEGVVDAIEYGPDGKRTRLVYANGLETRRTFTPGDALLDTIVTEPTGGGDALQHLVHTLDALGRVERIDDLSAVAGKVRNNQTFSYDSRNRLAHATGSAGATYAFDYTYDLLGNLIDGETVTGMVYGSAGGDAAHPNRLVRRSGAAGTEFTYDQSGDLLADPDIGTLQYDVRHRLVRVDRPDGTVVEFTYDHDDRRVATHTTDPGPGAGTRRRLEVDSIYIVDDNGTTCVVFDEDRRLALLPSTGDGLLHHFDRLGNVNVVSNLATGAFATNDEHTPFGQLSASVMIQPHYSFQGALVTDGIGIVLLGARWYNPTLGRFLTPDTWLAIRQDRIPGIIAGINLYLFALDNPANFTDPSGRLAFLVILLIAAVVGLILGGVGAAVNGVDTWDEFALWMVGGAIGGVLAVFGWTAIILGASYIFGLGVSATAAATIGLVIFGTAGLLGAATTKFLDLDTDSGVAWAFSFLIKWVQSPVLTTIGLIAAAIAYASGNKVDFSHGMLFIEVGSGYSGITLGAVGWMQSGCFNPDGSIQDTVAKHESTHSRTIASIGELGFYFTYGTIGGIWGEIQGGGWVDLNAMGCGNPFEKHAHTFTGDPGTSVSASDC